MVYFNQTTNPKKQLIDRVVFRPKGLILVTEAYDCFMYKESAMCQSLMDLIEFYKEHESEQLELWVYPNKKKKSGYTIEFGKPIRWYFSDEKASIDSEDIQEEVDFIKKLQTLNHPPSQQPKK